MNNGYVISTDKSKLVVAVIHDFLSNRSYWGRGRTVEAVQKTIENSLCFGAYDKKDRLVGFARVVTDLTIFAYLMDVFVLEEHRGLGLGKQLIDYIINYPALQDVRFWRLHTRWGLARVVVNLINQKNQCAPTFSRICTGDLCRSDRVEPTDSRQIYSSISLLGP